MSGGIAFRRLQVSEDMITVHVSSVTENPCILPPLVIGNFHLICH